MMSATLSLLFFVLCECFPISAYASRFFSSSFILFLFMSPLSSFSSFLPPLQMTWVFVALCSWGARSSKRRRRACLWAILLLDCVMRWCKTRCIKFSRFIMWKIWVCLSLCWLDGLCGRFPCLSRAVPVFCPAISLWSSPPIRCSQMPRMQLLVLDRLNSFLFLSLQFPLSLLRVLLCLERSPLLSSFLPCCLFAHVIPRVFSSCRPHHYRSRRYLSE